jgi:hypothetical protein
MSAQFLYLKLKPFETRENILLFWHVSQKNQSDIVKKKLCIIMSICISIITNINNGHFQIPANGLADFDK